MSIADPKLAAKFENQAKMLANKSQKAYKHLRKRFARQNVDAFRLYDWDIPEIRAVVDWYAGHLVIAEYTRKQSVPEWLPMMGAALAEAFKIPLENVHLKSRRAGKQNGMRYERIDTVNKKIVVSEGNLKFLVNPWDYVDTGLFSDHRNTRRMIREIVEGKDFLNLYCYTGSFSCYAAKGGARATTSVDRSETAIAWVRENMDLNGIPEPGHRRVQADTFDFLKQAKKSKQRYDLAVVDPPSYSTTRNRKTAFDIQQDHPRLLSNVCEIMKPGGLIFFSSNHQAFQARMETLDIQKIEEITRLTIPEDYARKHKKIHRCWKITV